MLLSLRSEDEMKAVKRSMTDVKVTRAAHQCCTDSRVSLPLGLCVFVKVQCIVQKVLYASIDHIETY